MSGFIPDAPKYNSEETKNRTSAQYVKFDPAYRVVLRILNEQAGSFWGHWVKEANNGRGLMARCPNQTQKDTACPVDNHLKTLDAEAHKEEIQNRKARKRYVVNVLDRTPYTTCGTCGNDTPKTLGTSPVCVNCGESTKKNKFEPLNRVKILEQGPRLFVEGLGAMEKSYQEDAPETTIMSYDITFTTQGEGRERKIAPMPQQPTEFSGDWLIDPETKDPQPLFNLDLLTEPHTSEQIELMMEGASVEEINAVVGA